MAKYNRTIITMDSMKTKIKNFETELGKNNINYFKYIFALLSTKPNQMELHENDFQFRLKVKDFRPGTKLKDIYVINSDSDPKSSNWSEKLIMVVYLMNSCQRFKIYFGKQEIDVSISNSMNEIFTSDKKIDKLLLMYSSIDLLEIEININNFAYIEDYQNVIKENERAIEDYSKLKFVKSKLFEDHEFYFEKKSELKNNIILINGAYFFEEKFDAFLKECFEEKVLVLVESVLIDAERLLLKGSSSFYDSFCNFFNTLHESKKVTSETEKESFLSDEDVKEYNQWYSGMVKTLNKLEEEITITVKTLKTNKHKFVDFVDSTCQALGEIKYLINKQYVKFRLFICFVTLIRTALQLLVTLIVVKEMKKDHIKSVASMFEKLKAYIYKNNENELKKEDCSEFNIENAISLFTVIVKKISGDEMFDWRANYQQTHEMIKKMDNKMNNIIHRPFKPEPKHISLETFIVLLIDVLVLVQKLYPKN